MARISFPKASPNNLTVSNKRHQVQMTSFKIPVPLPQQSQRGFLFQERTGVDSAGACNQVGPPKSQLPEMLEEHKAIWWRCRI